MNPKIFVTQDRDTCFRLRHTVFVEEQGVPIEEEIDALDQDAVHLLAEIDGTPIGTARIVMALPVAKIGRVCVLSEGRGTGLGQALIRAAMQIARETDGVERVRLGAQVHATGFYLALGFEPEGAVYLDAGIDHQDMVAEL